MPYKLSEVIKINLYSLYFFCSCFRVSTLTSSLSLQKCLSSRIISPCGIRHSLNVPRLYFTFKIGVSQIEFGKLFRIICFCVNVQAKRVIIRLQRATKVVHLCFTIITRIYFHCNRLMRIFFCLVCF